MIVARVQAMMKIVPRQKPQALSLAHNFFSSVYTNPPQQPLSTMKFQILFIFAFLATMFVSAHNVDLVEEAPESDLVKESDERELTGYGYGRDDDGGYGGGYKYGKYGKCGKYRSKYGQYSDKYRKCCGKYGGCGGGRGCGHYGCGHGGHGGYRA
jgi:hypothetical protein